MTEISSQTSEASLGIATESSASIVSAITKLEFPAWVDSSMRGEWAACEMKWNWAALRNLSPMGSNVHLTAGGAFARGIEVTRKGLYLDQLSLDEALFNGKVAAWEDWLKSGIEPKFSFESGAPLKKALDRVWAAMDYYFYVAWPPHSDPVSPYRTPAGKLGVEFTFAIPIPGTRHPVTGDPILYTGRFDMLGVKDDVLFVVDEKTTSQLGPTWPDQWEMRGQLTGYCWAAREYGFPVGGAIIRGVAFLTETKGNPSGFNHAQTITYRDDWRIEQWLAQLRTDVQDMIDAYNRGSFSYNLADACNSYGGCPFKKLCLVRDPEPWFADYEPRNWNPLSGSLAG